MGTLGSPKGSSEEGEGILDNWRDPILNVGTNRTRKWRRWNTTGDGDSVIPDLKMNKLIEYDLEKVQVKGKAVRLNRKERRRIYKSRR
jgi:hypothetical protein